MKHIIGYLFYATLCGLSPGLSASSTEAEGVPTGTVERDATFTDCGGVMKATRGILSTPGFPDSYPVPIRCRWVIEAPSDKVVNLYFTQFYMREGVTVSEYAFFSETLYLGKKEFGTISSDREPTYLVSNKPVLVLEFESREGGNVHLRVREHLLDVFGFNVTYEMIGRNETVRKDPCLYNHCSFTGSCLASTFFDGYYCRCFADFFGSECQYNPGCEPSDSGGLCLNGGTCRYHIGSTVKTCECPSGYEGVRCHKRKSEHSQAHCIELGCSQNCSPSSNDEFKCTCYTGYTLADDRKTCIEKGRTRYLVSFKLYDQNVDLAHLDASRYNLLKKGIESALLQLFEPRLYKAENLTVLNFQPGAVVQFHFFGEKEDSHQAKTVFEDSLKRGRIGRYAVDKNYIRFEWEPALSIQGIEPSEKMPVVQGTELSLACIMQGSSAMKVEWFKDTKSIDVETSFRRIWTTLVPKNSKDQYTALLGFDKAHVLDTGEFTCQVTDWGTVQNKSVSVTVITVPHPLVIPQTATVIQGSPFVVTCLSEEDQFGNFGYNWLKNGKILNPSIEPEMIEDLFPAGSRLVVKDARASATYTCIITSTAGATRQDCVVTVLALYANVPLCAPEKYMDVKWGQTAANTEDIQLCPKGYSGEALRHCNLRKNVGGVWGQPDFSGCLSRDFLSIKEQFHSLRMGYRITTVATLLQNLKVYLNSMKGRFHIAEGEPVVDLLEGLQDYRNRDEKSVIDTPSNESQVFMDIVSFLLDSPQLIQKQSHVIKLHQQILTHGLQQGTSIAGGTFQSYERPSVVLEVGQVANEGQHILKFPSHRYARDTMGLPSSTKTPWLTDFVELDFNTWVMENLPDVNDSISIAVVFYKNFSAFLPERFVTRHAGFDVEYQLYSRLVAVAMQTAQKKSSSSTTAKPVSQSLRVKARLSHLNRTVNQHVLWNISCGLADFSQGNIQFLLEGCQPVKTGNYSLCQCNRVGTYAVLLTTYAQSEQLFFHESFDVIAGIGCALCAFLVFLTMFILLVLWRKVRGAINAMKIQVCLALLGAYGAILNALNETLEKEFYPYVVTSILFFFLAAFCMQLCLGLTVYIEFVDQKGIRYPEFKLATLGWAVPMIVVGATLAAQVPEGFNLKSWWLELHTNYFYSYSASAVIMTVLHFLLVMTVKTELRCHQKLDSSKHAKSTNRMKLLHRSLVIMIFLLLVSVTSILYINYEDDLYKYAFAGSSGLLGLIIFLCYTVCSENVHAMCSSSSSIEEEEDMVKQEPRVKSRKGSFQGFSKPEIVSDSCISKIAETIEVDVRLGEIRKLGYQIPVEGKDWKNMDHLILDRENPTPPPPCIVRDFTVHHHHSQQGPTGSRPRDIFSLTRNDSDNGFRSEMAYPDPNSSHTYRKASEKRRDVEQKSGDPLSPPFELQRLEESPKSGHVHFYEDEEEEGYELNHQGSAPDILEPTNHQTYEVSDIEHAAASCQSYASNVPGDDRRALVQEHSKTICSTFRPPESPHHTYDVRMPKGGNVVVEFQKQESDSDDQKPGSYATLPCPAIQSMIGDDILVERTIETSKDTMSRKTLEHALRKEGMKKVVVPVGLNVPTPKVPTCEQDKTVVETDPNSQSKKGWSITTV